MRTATAFAQIERSIKASVSPGVLYPPAQNGGPSTHWINWQGWEAFEKQAQTEGQRDLQRAKTAVTSPWVFADVQALANEFSTSELIVKERKADKLEDAENHALELLWESPNEHMGRSFVSSFWAWSYVLSSRAYLYWVPDTSGTELMEVWPVPPWMIRPVPDKDNFISGYAFKASQYSDTIIIPPELITYSHSVNLFDVRDGMSFLAAAMTEVNADLAASLWNLNFFDENNGVPDGIISLSKDALDPDIERVRMELRDFFGGVKRGLSVVRDGDLKYTGVGRNQKDMEFGQGRELASKIIGRTLGFPDGYWSDLANRANAEQARRTMISGAVWPLLVRLSEDMNAKRRGVVHRWYGDQYRVEFKDIRPEDRQLKMEELKTRMSYWTLDELREADDKEPIGDVRGTMLIAEITKGAPIPGSEAAQELEDQQAQKDEQAAQQQAAAIEAGAQPPPAETPPEAAPPAEGEAPPPEEGAPVKAIDDQMTAWRGQVIQAMGDATDALMMGEARAADLRKWEAKAQDASERAMFAKMGAAGKLREKNSKGDRTGPREPKAGGGGGGGASAGEAAKGGGSGSAAPATSTKGHALGDSLHVADANDATVKAHVRDLNKIPPALANSVKDAGFKGVYVGKGSVPDLDDMGHLRNVQPRGYAAGQTWSQSGGAYSPIKKIAVVGTLKAKSASVALHEYGHAVGQHLGYDNDKRVIAIHKKLYGQGKLSPYHRQGGPGGAAGRQEMFAEGFALTVKDRNRAVDRYGSDFVNLIEKDVLKGKPARP